MSHAGNRTPRDAVDHLLLGASDLDQGIAYVEQQTGLRARVGGSHPGAGTRNALLSLGSRQYLEIIAPDPSQSSFGFQIDLRRLEAPKLVTWAAATTDLDAVVARARAADVGVFGPRDGSRVRPDGVTLRWRSAGIRGGLVEGDVDVMPFFIQWSADSVHPSEDAPHGCRLVAFGIQHPRPAKVKDTLRRLGIEADPSTVPQATLKATIDTPRGRVVLS
jgi:hypothetical protein